MMKRAAGAGSHDRAVLWLACAIALCAGYYIAFFRLGAEVDAQHDRAGQINSLVRADAATLSERPQLERTERSVAQSLQELDLRADRATLVARFIRAAAAAAARQHTRLEQIDERGSPPFDPRNATRTAESPAFETIALDVSLTGSYRDLIATIRELAAVPLAIHIEVAGIEHAAGDPGMPEAPLTGRLHVVLERLTTATSAALTSAPSPASPDSPERASLGSH